MRWDLLFDDLESQLDQEQRDEERALAIEEERLRLARLSLRERLVAMAAESGAPLRLELADGECRSIRPTGFGRDWLSGDLVDTAHGPRRCVLPLAAVAAVLPSREQVRAGLAPVAPRANALQERIGLSFVLRDLCRRRSAVALTTAEGRFHGTIDRVARDHLDLAVHEPAVPRREREVRGYRIVPFERIRLVGFE
ncbi:hypothetical protein FLP10_03000 [Agromyces intestinalis]|uniref:Uncharacterized protein n=1 Tax=Agromyces intestinalis TaxID=2592652 RepID=A0A5C1YBP2_9MICO|nr:hypothetical protein [Agromyces intestinalis]QEO13494.1 hypothetical protein FLP10_03000 [Agromyces intestinalis]